MKPAAAITRSLTKKAAIRQQLEELFEERDRGKILRTTAWIAKLDLVHLP
jgi:hypothetical protein